MKASDSPSISVDKMVNVLAGWTAPAGYFIAGVITTLALAAVALAFEVPKQVPSGALICCGFAIVAAGAVLVYFNFRRQQARANELAEILKTGAFKFSYDPANQRVVIEQRGMVTFAGVQQETVQRRVVLSRAEAEALTSIIEAAKREGLFLAAGNPVRRETGPTIEAMPAEMSAS